MKIDFTEEEILIIRQLCDIGLKAGGLNNLVPVTKLLTKINKTGLSGLDPIITNKKQDGSIKRGKPSKSSEA
jgi:hypothetical protein